MISIYKRGRVWWVRGTVAGQKIRRSLSTTSKEAAWELAKQIEMQTICPRVSWEEFATEFLAWISPSLAHSTRRKYEFIVGRFSRFLISRGIVWLHSIGPGMFPAYAAERAKDIHPKRHIPVGTGIRSDFRILHRIFSYAKQCRYVPENPVQQTHLNRTDSETLPFERGDIERMLSDKFIHSRSEFLALILFFLTTGMRISDVIACQRSSVRFANGTIVIPKMKKTRQQLILSLRPDLRKALETHIASFNQAQDSSGLLFPSLNGQPQASLDAKLRRLWNRCGVLNGHAHRFRDTFAVSLLERGATLYDVSKLLGNSMAVCERHYSPWVRELQERAHRFINSIEISSPREHTERTK